MRQRSPHGTPGRPAVHEGMLRTVGSNRTARSSAVYRPMRSPEYRRTGGARRPVWLERPGLDGRGRERSVTGPCQRQVQTAALHVPVCGIGPSTGEPLMSTTMNVRRTVLAAAVGVSGATAALASPAAAAVITDTPPGVTVSPQTDIVANQTPVTVSWEGRPSGPLSVDLCDMSNTNSCVAVYSSAFEANEGSVTRTLPGSVNGKR